VEKENKVTKSIVLLYSYTKLKEINWNRN